MRGVEIDRDLATDVFQRCHKCHFMKRLAPATKMNPHDNALLPLDLVHIDHIVLTSHPSVDGHTGVVSVRDDCSRYVFFLAVKKLALADAIQQLITIMAVTGRRIKEIYSDHAFHGKPKFINWCKSENIKMGKRPSNFSRGNKVERSNREFHKKVEHFCSEHKYWNRQLHRLSNAINCQPCASTGFTPFYLFFGVSPAKVPNSFLESASEMSILDDMWMKSLILAQCSSKLKSDKNRSKSYKYPKIDTGSKVLVRYKNDKFSKSLKGTILQDFNSTCQVEIENYSQPVEIHKSHIFILTKEGLKKSEPIVENPVASRTRSKKSERRKNILTQKNM